MTLKKRLFIIQSIYWVGAIADAIWTVALISPWFYGVLTGRNIAGEDLSIRLIMGISASLMAGWTVLLIWAAQQPIVRKGVMLITVIPTLTGLSIVTLIGINNGHNSSIWIFAKIILLAIAMLVGYFIAGTIREEDVDENQHTDTYSKLPH